MKALIFLYFKNGIVRIENGIVRIENGIVRIENGIVGESETE